MSTPNFHKTHAKNYYVITGEYIDEDTQQTTPWDCYEWEEYINDIPNQIQSILNGKQSNDYTPTDNATRFMKNNSQNVASIEFDFKRLFDKDKFPYDNDEFRFRINTHIYLNDGYYVGANLDWDIELEDNFWIQGLHLSEYDTIKDMIDDFIEQVEYQFKCNYDKFQGFYVEDKIIAYYTILQQINKAIEKAELICKQMCDDTYLCIGIYSNGEAVYEKAV